jgi:uncharacterized FlaG/YvyC family protein
MDVPVVGSAQAGQQPAPPVASPQGGQTQAPQPVLQDAPRVENTGVLSPVVAKIFGGGDGVSKPVTVNVSYRVEHDPNIIVTVFRDPATGREIAQIPAEVMVQIAQFFDKESGVTLDRSA